MSNFSKDVSNWSDSVKCALTQIFQDVVIGVGNDVIHLTAVKTGRLRGNWQLTIDKDSNYSLDNYDKSGSKTLATLIGESKSLTAGQVAYITNNILYGPHIEYFGVQKPEGMVRVTSERFLHTLKNALEKVK